MIEEENENKDEQEPTPINVDTLLDKQQKETRAKFASNKKKYLDTNIAWGMFILIALAIFGIGYALNKSVSLGAGLAILAIILSFLAAIIFYTIGKILGGLLGGYEVCRIEFFGVNMVKNGKNFVTTFSIMNFFEFHIGYKPREGEEDPKPYRLMVGGILGFIVCSALEFGLSFLPAFKSSDVRIALWYAIAFGSLVILYEIFPGHFDNPNDMFITIITKKPEDRQAYNLYLNQNYADMIGVMPEVKTFDSYDNSRTKPLTLLAVLNSQVYAGQYQESLATLEKLEGYEIVLSDNARIEALLEKLYLYLIHGRTREAEKLIISLDKMEKNASDYHPSISALRCQVAIAGLLDNSLESLKASIDDFLKGAKKLDQSSARLKSDIDLVNSSFYIIRKAHPAWKFDNISLEKIEKAKEEDKPQTADKKDEDENDY